MIINKDIKVLSYIYKNRVTLFSPEFENTLTISKLLKVMNNDLEETEYYAQLHKILRKFESFGIIEIYEKREKKTLIRFTDKGEKIGKFAHELYTYVNEIERGLKIKTSMTKYKKPFPVKPKPKSEVFVSEVKKPRKKKEVKK